MSCSCRKPPLLFLLLLALSLAQFCGECLSHSFACAPPQRDQPDVFMRKVQSPRDVRDNAAYSCGFSKFSARRSKIHGGYQLSEKGHYAEPRMNVKEKTRLRVNAESRPEIARAFRAARQSLGMSQDELAKAIGSVQDTISRWERGKDSPPISALIALTELLPEDEKGPWLAITGQNANEGRGEKSLDSELLAQVLQAVETEANKAGIVLPRVKYAEIVAGVYDVWRKTGPNKTAIVERLIGQVFGPSNHKVEV